MPPEEEVVDAESSTLNKQVGPRDHLMHLLKIGWRPDQPLIQNFVDQHSLHDEVQNILNQLGK